MFLRPWLLVCLFTALMFSCKSARVVSGGTVDENLSSRAIIRNHYRNQPDFKTLSGRMKIDYTDGEAEHSFNVSLRMEKDKAIWISAPLGVVKAFITPGRVTFYNKMQNEYFDGDFSYLSRYLGTELDFEKVQNLLLGQALFDLRDGRYTMAAYESTYELKPSEEQALFKIFYRLDPGNFKISSEQRRDLQRAQASRRDDHDLDRRHRRLDRQHDRHGGRRGGDARERHADAP
jgi:hypothetical protein